MNEAEKVFSRYQGYSPLTKSGGKLFFGQCDCTELVEKYGSPLYVYDEERIKSNYRRVSDAFRKHYENFSLYYAVKSNNNLAILRILQKEGSGADVSSPSEIYLAKKAGFDKILYSGNYHTDSELTEAVEGGITLNLDSIEQIERIKSLGLSPKKISFRINPGIGAGGHEKLIFAGPEIKFGIRESEAVEAYKKAKGCGIEEFGIHMMTGSNILDPGYFPLITGKLMDIAAKIEKNAGMRFSFVDIGGGLGIPYRPDDPILDVGSVAEKVCDSFKNKIEEHGFGQLTLMMEPGRYIVGDAGMLLAKVHSIKLSDKTFIGTDAGMNTLLRPALYNAYHPILLANNLEAPEVEKATVVGQICENTDHLARDRLLPKISRGDILAGMNAGAYGFAMSSQYNTRPRASEVLVNNGKHEMIRRRETDEDIDRNVIVPPRLK